MFGQTAEPFLYVLAERDRFLLLGDRLDQLADADDWLVAGARMADVIEDLLQAVVNDEELALALVQLVLAGVAAAAQLQNLIVVLDDLLHLRRGEILGQADAPQSVLPAVAGFFD